VFTTKAHRRSRDRPTPWDILSQGVGLFVPGAGTFSDTRCKVVCINVFIEEVLDDAAAHILVIPTYTTYILHTSHKQLILSIMHANESSVGNIILMKEHRCVGGYSLTLQPLLIGEEELFIDLAQRDVGFVVGCEIVLKASTAALVVLGQSELVFADERIDF